MADQSPTVVAVCRPLAGLGEGECVIPGAQVRVGPERSQTRAQLKALVEGVSGVISWVSDRIDGEVLDAAGEQLRVVASYGVGYDNIDVDACRDRGVVVTHTPHAVTEGTANMAIALMLAAGRRLVEGDRFVRSGAWADHGVLGPTDFIGVDFAGRLFLVVGAGRIGHAAALRARAFGMRVAYVARSRHPEFEDQPIGGERVTLEQGLELADVVSVHTPLTPETRGLIGAAELARMKQTAVFVNTARGPVVDEEALAEALESRQIFAAGLDVFEREPAVDERLRALDNVVLSPHMGSAEDRWRIEMTRMVCADVASVLAGARPAFPVPGSVGV